MNVRELTESVQQKFLCDIRCRGELQLLRLTLLDCQPGKTVAIAECAQQCTIIQWNSDVFTGDREFLVDSLHFVFSIVALSVTYHVDNDICLACVAIAVARVGVWCVLVARCLKSALYIC